MSVVRAHVGEPNSLKAIMTLIADNGGHKVFCETKKIHVGENNNHVRIYTTYEGSREPDYKQVKFEAFLTNEELEGLKQALTIDV